MCITEYNEKAVLDGIRQEGIEKGESIGKQQMIINLYADGMSIDKIAKIANVNTDTVRKWLSDLL